MRHKRKWLVVQIAALGSDFLAGAKGSLRLAGLEFKSLKSMFPAVTCSVQASFVTASAAQEHGMICNGFFDRHFRKAFFWEQSSQLVERKRFWQEQQDIRTAIMFWQQSLGSETDIVISPAPIHKHHGGMIMDCFSRPRDLYPQLVEKVGSRFPLHRYWGPLAGEQSSRWITEATCHVMADQSPDLLLTYIPHLDYELQRSGPASTTSREALETTEQMIATLVNKARQRGYDVLIFGDYAITAVDKVVFPNRVLAEAGYLPTRDIKGMSYPDLYTAAAFALCDHQIAHVYINDPARIDEVRDILSRNDNIDSVLDKGQQRQLQIAHPRSGELLLTTKPGAWFAYPWWTDDKKAPDYASHIDIHNKPGYDPCELFGRIFGLKVSLDTSLVKGSHGLSGPGTEAVWATTGELDFQEGTIVELAAALKENIQS